MLSDYIDFAIPQTGANGGRTLAFDRHVEYLIYRTLPHTLGARLARGAQVPVGFIAGTHSKEVRQVGLELTRRIAGEHFEWIEGSHLYPMERPIETARAVQRMLNCARRSRFRERLKAATLQRKTRVAGAGWEGAFTV